MFASVIVVCSMLNGQCALVANGLYRTEEQCNQVSQLTIENNMERAERGEFPPHMAFYTCIDFGIAM